MINRKLDATSGAGGGPRGATEVDQELQLGYSWPLGRACSPHKAVSASAVSYPKGSMPSHKPKTFFLTLHYISPFLH